MIDFGFAFLCFFRFAVEYMSLPASQYSVLDAERIERVDDNTFRCYVYTFKFFNFEVCPVLLVRVEEQTNGCCIKLLSCKVGIKQREMTYIIISMFILSLSCDIISLRDLLLWLLKMINLMVSISLCMIPKHYFLYGIDCSILICLLNWWLVVWSLTFVIF